MLKLFIFG